jgi:hypothetical protein
MFTERQMLKNLLVLQSTADGYACSVLLKRAHAKSIEGLHLKQQHLHLVQDDCVCSVILELMQVLLLASPGSSQ